MMIRRGFANFPDFNIRRIFPSKTRLTDEIMKNMVEIKEEKEVKVRRMKDSYIELRMPFSKDNTLKEEYINYYGGLRIGKIMEDMDALAGHVAYRHCGTTPMNERRPLTIVTASVDRIDLLKRIGLDKDIRLSGFVSYAGRTSLEVILRLESKMFKEKKEDEKLRIAYEPSSDREGWEVVALAGFTMVARNTKDHSPETVPSLELRTKEEDKLFNYSKERRNFRRNHNETSVFKQAPTIEESKILHEIFLKGEESEKVMGESTMQNTIICHPQEKNIYGFMFGGFLMREAFELAFSNASKFTKGRPDFVSLDETIFKQPVPIGSLLVMTSQVIYSIKRLCQIRVVAELLDVTNGNKTVSNTFYFTFEKRVGHTMSIIPKSYLEGMFYLEGKRKLEQGLAENANQNIFNDIVQKVLY